MMAEDGGYLVRPWFIPLLDELRQKHTYLLGLRSSRRYLLDELDNLSKRQELVKAELARVDAEIAKSTDSLSKQQ